jgi:hypothetical protein
MEELLSLWCKITDDRLGFQRLVDGEVESRLLRVPEHQARGGFLSDRNGSLHSRRVRLCVLPCLARQVCRRSRRRGGQISSRRSVGSFRAHLRRKWRVGSRHVRVWLHAFVFNKDATVLLQEADHHAHRCLALCQMLLAHDLIHEHHHFGLDVVPNKRRWWRSFCRQ